MSKFHSSLIGRASRRVIRTLRRFGREKRGSAAVEFAAVAAPFFYLMFAMCETAMIFVAQTSLDMAVADVQRLVRVGAVQDGRMGQTQVRNVMCARMQQFMITDCATALVLDIDTFPDFGSVALSNPVRNGAIDPAQVSYDPGGPESIVLVRAYYTWKINTPMFEGILANMNDGKRILTSATLMRVEPYPT